MSTANQRKKPVPKFRCDRGVAEDRVSGRSTRLARQGGRLTHDPDWSVDDPAAALVSSDSGRGVGVGSKNV